MDGVGNRAQLNKLPPKTAIKDKVIIPRNITTSGGVSLFGTFASLLGSAVIALLAVELIPVDSILNTNYFLLLTAAGIAGSLFDSFLGATVQAMYFCPKDNKETEKHPIHTCGTQTVQIRGWKWLDNDWVNLGCGAFGVTVAIGMFLL